jgi:hypothetical protein
LYLFYTAGTLNGTTYSINLAIASGTTLLTLFGGNQGVQNIPISAEPSLDFNTLASDNFTRANSNPIGGNWSQRFVGSGYAPAQLLSDAAAGAIAGDNCDSYWNNTNWSSNQWTQVTVGSCSNSSYIGFVLRGGANQYINTAYRFYWNGNLGSAGVWTLAKVVNGSNTSLATGSLTLNVGDVLTGAIIGTTIMVYWNGLLLDVITDSSIVFGSPGFLIVPATNVSDVSITAWSGGNFVGLFTPPLLNSAIRTVQTFWMG